MRSLYKNLFEFENKTVVVTGGLGYLGQEIVRALLDLGSNVAIFDKSMIEHKKHFEVITLKDSAFNVSPFEISPFEVT